MFLNEEDYNDNIENIDFTKHDYLNPKNNLFFLYNEEDVVGSLEELDLSLNYIYICTSH